MDWKIPAGIAIAVCLLFINFWWLTAGRKKARLDRDGAPDNARMARFEIS